MKARSPAPSDRCLTGIFMQMHRFLPHLVYRNETCSIPAASASWAKLPETCGETLWRGNADWVGAESAAIRRELLSRGLKNACLHIHAVSLTLFVLGRNSFAIGAGGFAFGGKLGSRS